MHPVRYPRHFHQLLSIYIANFKLLKYLVNRYKNKVLGHTELPFGNSNFDAILHSPPPTIFYKGLPSPLTYVVVRP